MLRDGPTTPGRPSKPAVSPARGSTSCAAPGAGLDQLRRAVEQAVCRQDKGAEAVVPATAVRCADSLRRAAESLARARRLAGRGDAEELVAAELRAALDALGEVTGTVCSEDILDIFQRFCIGK